MNHLLFDRQAGSLSHQAFARLHLTSLIQAIQPAPGIFFDGGETLEKLEEGDVVSEDDGCDWVARQTTWAHKAGANALAIDKFDGRL